MSLILTWEHEPQFATRRASLWRDGILVNPDVPMGMVEDTENDDPAAVYDIRGAPNAVLDADISRYLRSPTMCAISCQLGRPNRRVDILMPSTQALLLSVHANSAGTLTLFLRARQHVLVQLEGEPLMLDTVVPGKQDVTWDELVANGSRQVIDTRGLY